MTTIAEDITDFAWADRIDSRDVAERIDELGGRDDLDEIESAELADLIAFREECEGYAGDSFRDGVFFVADRELAEDIGAIDPKAGWPNSHIDWDAAADALKDDYTSADLRGHTFWYR